jgi:hypothetical protein
VEAWFLWVLQLVKGERIAMVIARRKEEGDFMVPEVGGLKVRRNVARCWLLVAGSIS